MTVLGWFGGEGLSGFMFGMNYWIAAGLLFFIGTKMIYESRRPESRASEFDPTRGWSLVALSVATSIDALAVGVTFSLIGTAVWTPALVIGFAALIMSFIGAKLGRSMGPLLGQWAERLGGAVLIGIGIRVLVEFLSK
jgi:putative Mn2+ efflux pump MntP